jgi:Recombination directionality factor-like
MALLDLQRRGQQIGRLRLGQLVPTKDGKMRPGRLDTFRFTTRSRHSADAIADLYGGTVQDWNGQFEVITTQNAIGVTIPPRDQIVSQWYEMWNRGGATRRCDSRIEQLSGGPCLCPHADDIEDYEQVEAAAKERARLAKLNPPQACKTQTRISVMIPDLPGLGIFRLDTGSYYAAVEIGDAAAVMQAARNRDIYLPAILRIDQREKVAEGKTTKYPVPVLEVLVTLRQIVTGALAAGGAVAQLPPPPGQAPRALTAGAPAPSAAQPTAPQAEAPPRPKNAQDVADLALRTTDADEVDRLGIFARSQGWGEDLVEIGEDVLDELLKFLRERWDALRQPEGGAE